MLKREHDEQEVLDQAEAASNLLNNPLRDSQKAYNASQLDPRKVGKMQVLLNEDSVFSVDKAHQKTSINALNSKLGRDSFDKGSQDVSAGFETTGIIMSSAPDHMSHLDYIKSRRASAIPSSSRPNIDRFLLKDSRSHTRGDTSSLRTAARSHVEAGKNAMEPGDRLPQMQNKSYVHMQSQTSHQ